MHHRSSPPLTVRRGTLADAEHLSSFARRLAIETFAAQNNPDDFELYLSLTFSAGIQARQIADPSRTFLLGEVATEQSASQLAAYALIRSPSPEPNVHGAKPVEIERFYIDGPWQGTGVADVMMQHAVEHARAVGGETLWLGVWEHNPRAIRFYQRHGFVDVGSHPFLVGTDLQTDRVMARSLFD
jgi:ribosomal protein S18 acetylase RimI-like enzyme